MAKNRPSSCQPFPSGKSQKPPEYPLLFSPTSCLGISRGHLREHLSAHLPGLLLHACLPSQERRPELEALLKAPRGPPSTGRAVRGQRPLPPGSSLQECHICSELLPVHASSSNGASGAFDLSTNQVQAEDAGCWLG